MADAEEVASMIQTMLDQRRTVIHQREIVRHRFDEKSLAMFDKIAIMMDFRVISATSGDLEGASLMSIAISAQLDQVLERVRHLVH